MLIKTINKGVWLMCKSIRDFVDREEEYLNENGDVAINIIFRSDLTDEEKTYINQYLANDIKLK